MRRLWWRWWWSRRQHWATIERSIDCFLFEPFCSFNTAPILWFVQCCSIHCPLRQKHDHLQHLRQVTKQKLGEHHIEHAVVRRRYNWLHSFGCRIPIPVSNRCGVVAYRIKKCKNKQWKKWEESVDQLNVGAKDIVMVQWIVCWWSITVAATKFCKEVFFYSQNFKLGLC